MSLDAAKLSASWSYNRRFMLLSNPRPGERCHRRNSCCRSLRRSPVASYMVSKFLCWGERQNCHSHDWDYHRHSIPRDIHFHSQTTVASLIVMATHHDTRALSLSNYRVYVAADSESYTASVRIWSLRDRRVMTWIVTTVPCNSITPSVGAEIDTSSYHWSGT